MRPELHRLIVGKAEETADFELVHVPRKCEPRDLDGSPQNVLEWNPGYIDYLSTHCVSARQDPAVTKPTSAFSTHSHSAKNSAAALASPTKLDGTAFTSHDQGHLCGR